MNIYWWIEKISGLTAKVDILYTARVYFSAYSLRLRQACATALDWSTYSLITGSWFGIKNSAITSTEVQTIRVCKVLLDPSSDGTVFLQSSPTARLRHLLFQFNHGQTAPVATATIYFFMHGMLKILNPTSLTSRIVRENNAISDHWQFNSSWRAFSW